LITLQYRKFQLSEANNFNPTVPFSINIKQFHNHNMTPSDLLKLEYLEPMKNVLKKVLLHNNLFIEEVGSLMKMTKKLK